MFFRFNEIRIVVIRNIAKGMLKLALVGADRRTHKMLQLFFSGPGKGSGCLVAEADAEADIVDIAGFNGDRVWKHHRSRYKRPAIVLSVDEKNFPGAIWVPKPIQKADFLKAIGELKLRIEKLSSATRRGDSPAVAADSALSAADKFSAREYSLAAGKALIDYQHEYACGEYSDAVYLDPMYRSRLFYHPEHTLQHAVSRGVLFGRESGANIVLSGLPEPLTVFSSGRYVYSPLSSSRLRKLTQHELSRRELALKSLTGDFMVNDGDPNIRRADRFLWEVALLSSRGRVPFGTDLNAKVGLKAWPNLTRLMITPHAMQLASLWHSEPLMLNETAEKLGIRYRYVYSFYSACDAMGLLVINPDTADSSLDASVAMPEKGFLKRLLGYLNRSF